MNGARVLLLAAGRGRRAGGPKAWRAWEGKTLLEAHLDFFGKLIGPSAVSVSIQPEWRARCEKLSSKAIFVDADPDASPLDSLQRLIKASPPARSFILHVDMPIFETAIYESLWNMTGDAVLPVFNGHRGHPVLAEKSYLAKISALHSMSGRLDTFLRQSDVAEVPVRTPLIHRNLNEPVA